ncbi:uncharacterized protein N7483_011587 [Penicillium malachiteum]|uniref:uncharacterized protein n=1 Tax=Penicillium malachiteum TaxID=1324776 RepID=UPI00254853D5|nr:uncharacterized protein N7483_011587 [Penicillium malachiteum]KAJ5714406.1 hypothetical protein N7483_011587 [Penicillium malachiteum]
MSTAISSKHHVVVLGAGVIGLQTALTILSHDIRVTLLSVSWPGCLSDPYYTSMFSGAQWRSNPDMNDRRQQSWDRTTLLHWRDLLACHAPSELGLELHPAVFFWDSPVPVYRLEKSHWWITDPDLMPVRDLGPDDCAAPGNADGAGFAYQTITVNPVVYCTWLLRQCESAPEGQFETRVLHVKSFSQVFDEVPGTKAVVNCTGLGAGKLADDEACFPTLGQTVLVKGKAHRVVTRRNEQEEQPWEALVIPRPGEEITVLGGVQGEGGLVHPAE